MIKNYELALESGHLKDTVAQIIELDRIEDYDRSEVIVLTTGTQGEPRSALVRVSKGEHAQIDLQEGDRILMSSRFIPGNEKSVGRMINNLFKQGGEVLYESTHQIHVSGHATRPELKQMIEWTKPKFFLPIHGEYRHLIHHARLAEETGLKPEQILVASNGDVLHLSANRFERIYQLEEEPKRFIDGPLANEITRDILRDRRKLAETGAVFILMTQDGEYLNIIAGPEVVLRGITTPEREDELALKIKKEVALIVKEAICQANQGNLKIDLKEEIRVQVRKLVYATLGKKPVVIPFILEL
jgi:ribonuclease J